MCFILMMGLVASMVAQDDCPYDLNGDGMVNVGDVLVLLGSFGMVCG